MHPSIINDHHFEVSIRFADGGFHGICSRLTSCWSYDYSSMPGLKSIHISKFGPLTKAYEHYENYYTTLASNKFMCITVDEQVKPIHKNRIHVSYANWIQCGIGCLRKHTIIQTYILGHWILTNEKNHKECSIQCNKVGYPKTLNTG